MQTTGRAASRSSGGALARACALLPEPVRRFFRAYEAGEPEAAAFRAKQLQAVLRLTPLAMPVNVVNAALALFVLWEQVSRAFLLAWIALICAMAALGYRGWRHARRHPPRSIASLRATRRAAWQATVLGTVWAALPAVTFAQAGDGGRFFVGMISTGMICAGGFILSPIPWAATGYVATLSLGAAAALASWEAPEALGTAGLLLAYGGVVIYSAWTYAKLFGARMVAEAQAERQSEIIGLLLRDVEDQSSDLIWELDARGRFAQASQRLAETLGAAPARLHRLRAGLLLRPFVPSDEEARQQWRELEQRLAARAPFRDGVLTLSTRGGQRWWLLSARPQHDRNGRFGGWRGIAADITDKQVAHQRLKWLAHNDALTGLVNRTQFRELLQAELRGPAARGNPLAVVTFDLDGFKQTNDTHGHAAGDQLLRAFGARLLSLARRSDTVARLGGDEFAMLVRGAASEAEIRPLLERVLASLAEPLVAGGARNTLRASLGVAFAPRDGAEVDELMSHADIALYAAKRAGGHRYHFFQPHMAEGNRRRVLLEQSLHGAVARGEFRLVYQPQVRADDGRLCGFEALLRWRHPELGEIAPGEFIGIAERCGLMPAIGTWVLHEACREAHGWPEDVAVSVNVSPTQLGADGFVEVVRSATEGLAPQRVELEITESALVDDADAAVAVLNALRTEGWRLALDDFGTGYSALGYLRRFSFDTLKIDRSFVRDLASDGEAQAIVDTILAMAGALGLSTVAEGVEEESQAALLRARGCRVLQGYLVSRPLAPGDCAAFLRGRAEPGPTEPAGPTAPGSA